MITYQVNVYENGSQAWLLNDKLHREDGPAVIYPDGSQYWFLNGKRHREDGPAVIRPDGYQAWWLNGQQYTKQEFLEKTKKHVIIIDGKTVHLSNESYDNLKRVLIG